MQKPDLTVQLRIARDGQPIFTSRSQSCDGGTRRSKPHTLCGGNFVAHAPRGSYAWFSALLTNATKASAPAR